MKSTLKPFIFSVLLLCQMAIVQISVAQPPPPEVNGSMTNENPREGGGAPIDGGLAVALFMVAGFGAWKWYKTHEKLNIKI